MKLNTVLLFQLLIRIVKPDLICDIGSLDGSASILFRKILKKTRIIAFEPNPYLVKDMYKNKTITNSAIEIQEKAVWKINDTLEFNIININSTDSHDCRRGISSIYKRNSSNIKTERIKVEAVRIDDFITNLDIFPEKVALWIDVEGSGYEVVKSMIGIRGSIKIVHIEVETEKIWENQKLKSDVEDLMKKFGFIKLARGYNNIQHDLVYLDLYSYLKSPILFILALLASYLMSLFQLHFDSLFSKLKRYYFLKKPL